MAIARFDDIPDLILYVNGSESVISKTGDVVDTVDPPASYTLPSTQMVQLSGTDTVLHDGLTKVGEVLAFASGTSNSNHGLMLDPMPSPVNLTTTGLTVVQLEQSWSGGSSSSTQFSFGLNDGSTANPETAIANRTSRLYNGYFRSVAVPTAVAATGDATVVGIRHDPGANTGSVYVNGTEYPLTHDAADSSVDRFCIFNRASYSSADQLRGKVAITVAYARKLTDQEMTDVHDLIAYWQANGEGPSVAPPGSAVFGPVTTNDDPSVTSWQWQESDDGVAWQDVGTILTDVTGQTTTTLTVNSAHIGNDQTQVRCRAINPAHPLGVFSHSATLTVVPA